jgi:hypothetical protein
VREPKPIHAEIIGAAAAEVMDRIKPPNGPRPGFQVFEAECPAITESSLDRQYKVPLLELWRQLQRGIVMSGALAENRDEALLFLTFLESVLGRLRAAPPQGTGSIRTLAPNRAVRNAGEQLSDRQCAILETMLEHEITSHRRRQTQPQIVRLINRNHNATSYKRDFAALALRGWLCSQSGPRGGMWLSPQHRAEIQGILCPDSPQGERNETRKLLPVNDLRSRPRIIVTSLDFLAQGFRDFV